MEQPPHNLAGAVLTPRRPDEQTCISPTAVPPERASPRTPPSPAPMSVPKAGFPSNTQLHRATGCGGDPGRALRREVSTFWRAVLDESLSEHQLLICRAAVPAVSLRSRVKSQGCPRMGCLAGVWGMGAVLESTSCVDLGVSAPPAPCIEEHRLHIDRGVCMRVCVCSRVVHRHPKAISKGVYRKGLKPGESCLVSRDSSQRAAHLMVVGSPGSSLRSGGWRKRLLGVWASFEDPAFRELRDSVLGNSLLFR